MPQLKLTPAQAWLVHTLEALFLSAVVAGTLAAYQSVATGNYGVVSLLSIGGAAILAVLCKGASSSILSNVNLLPALFDTAKNIESVVSAPVAVTPASIVTIHTAAPTQVQEAPVASVAPVQPAQVEVQSAPAPVEQRAQQPAPQVAFPQVDMPTLPLAAIRTVQP